MLVFEYAALLPLEDAVVAARREKVREGLQEFRSDIFHSLRISIVIDLKIVNDQRAIGHVILCVLFQIFFRLEQVHSRMHRMRAK